MIVLYHHREGGRWASAKEKHSGILSVSARLLIQSQPGRLEGLAASIVQKAHRKLFLQARPNMNRKFGFCPVQRGRLTFRLLFELVSNNLKPLY